MNVLEECGYEILDIKKYFVFKPSIIRIFKEIIKYFLPKKKSNLRYLLGRYQTDMFIRAKKKLKP